MIPKHGHKDGKFVDLSTGKEVKLTTSGSTSIVPDGKVGVKEVMESSTMSMKKVVTVDKPEESKPAAEESSEVTE